MSEIEFLYVPPGKALALWPSLLPHIDSALAYSAGEYEAQDLLDLAIDSKAQLWAAIGNSEILGAACSQVVDYPRARILYVLTMAGREFRNWVGLATAEAERFAKTQGCDLIRINGRAGWARRVREFGYAERYRQVDKAVAGDQ